MARNPRAAANPAVAGLENSYQGGPNLAMIQQRWKEHPGSAPNGSGTTGLNPADAHGWSRQQNENTWAMNQMQAQNGQAPMDIAYGGEPRRTMNPLEILQNMARMRQQGGGQQNSPFAVNPAQWGRG